MGWLCGVFVVHGVGGLGVVVCSGVWFCMMVFRGWFVWIVLLVWVGLVISLLSGFLVSLLEYCFAFCGFVRCGLRGRLWVAG